MQVKGKNKDAKTEFYLTMLLTKLKLVIPTTKFHIGGALEIDIMNTTPPPTIVEAKANSKKVPVFLNFLL